MSDMRRAQRWFDRVRDAYDDLDDPDNKTAFIDAVIGASDYFLEVEKASGNEMLIVGLMEGMIQENAALAYYYNTIHTDALQIRKYLETVLADYEVKKYVWFQTTSDGRAMLGSKPTATDLRNHIKATDVVTLLNDCIRLIADRQHILEDLREGFVTRGYNLKTISDIRVAKLEEVWLDGTRETNNS